MDATVTALDAATANLLVKGSALGEAYALEQELEDDRAAIKADAIVRVMKRDGLAATPAEKIVETDEQYFAHRAKQRASIVARYRADAEYRAAQAAATQASLITPSMIELQLSIADLTKSLKGAKREIDVKEIELRRSNGWLSERISDVERLTETNRQLTERIEFLQSTAESRVEFAPIRQSPPDPRF